MTIYIDENMPPALANGLNELQTPLNYRENFSIDVKSIKKQFGAAAQDEEWIPAVGKEGACVITQDYNIKRIKHQKALCEQYKLGMFYFRPPSKKGFGYWDMVKLAIKNWEQIIKIVGKEKRPFAYKISSKSKMEKL